jgi:pyridinium-3,5-bisthiocarboxylic acid mononucleotide nickel chelatase
MRIAYLDCFAGISGDMFLGALVDAGVDPQIFHEAIAALHLDAALRIEKVDRSGISSTKLHVFDGAQLADEMRASTSHVSPAQDHDHRHQQSITYKQQAKTQHQHKAGQPHGHDHDHSHEHTHGRSLSAIRALIHAANLTAPVKEIAVRAFELLGASEARVHNVPIEQIHFHEVGAVDAIVDIVAASAGIHALKIDRWYCSPLNVGGGMVDCAHGRFPVPAPATADLLRGLPTYSAHIEEELVTPTGAALIRVIAPTFGPQPAMRVESIGYGAGTRNPKGFPNVLRISIGESDETTCNADTVTVLETALDDLNPQIIGHVAEQALAQGALDVLCTPTQMKKGRPGTLITILCERGKASAIQQLLFRETSTLGIRVREEQRVILTRAFTTVNTPYGEIRIKTASLPDAMGGTETNATAEFEDCRAAAAKHHVPVKTVLQSALNIYFSGKE